MKNRERVLEFIQSESGVTDREIRERTGIQPHQQVNQICRRLAAAGLITREPGPDGLIRNYVASGSAPEHPPSSAEQRLVVSESAYIPDLSLGRTMFVIPCSSEKRRRGSDGYGGSILRALSTSLADELAAARQRNAAKVRLDGTLRMAIDRYSGTLYKTSGSAFQLLQEHGARIAIISGGYGLVLPEEPIAWYDCKFRARMWPNRLVERCLSSYAEASAVRTVVGILSASTNYAAVFRRTGWPDDVDAFLLSPESAPGAMVKAPRAQGEALAEIAATGSLGAEWRSSDGLKMEVTRL